MSSCTPRSTAYSQFDGWRIVGATALAVGGFVGAIAASAPDSDDAVHIVMRVTARMAVVLFLLAFSASSVAQLWPSAWTRWQRRNRRYLGVSFAVAHFTHFLAILSLRVIAPDHFATIPAVTWIFGGIAYVFVAAMTATSFDATAKAIGPKAWRVLHTTGSYYIWLIFAVSYLTRVVEMPEFAPIAAAVLAGLGLRVVARLQRRARARLAVTPEA
ncbi:MAG TPA: hypothetical protein VIL28_08470 [Steroidobacteraceae bacterium]